MNSVWIRWVLAGCWLAASAGAQSLSAGDPLGWRWDNNRPEIARGAEFVQRTVADIAAVPADAAQPLLVGWATTDITPPKPVALIGQLHKRISTGVRDPLTATVLSLETRGSAPEQAILVSCDVLFIQRQIQQRLQERIRTQLPDFDSRKLFLNATHTPQSLAWREEKHF